MSSRTASTEFGMLTHSSSACLVVRSWLIAGAVDASAPFLDLKDRKLEVQPLSQQNMGRLICPRYDTEAFSVDPSI